MLNERERGVLADIERNLVGSDPHLARLFQKLAYVRPRARGGAAQTGIRRRSMRDAGVAPCLMLVSGLLLIVLGGISAAVPVVGTGIVMALLAFVLAAVGTPSPRPGPAT
ncbi:DUF3040 domain-containing protein [Pseudonocardia benzenivorans]|uniref:DUF3040 domain-containing protein n=2 Tax=Pseudonocardia TaxID=1847 RepID=F4CXT2_PSEUX|nr:DUF3040 domain-containing protein [Pseudonocardia dioxanivorans]AEA28738.1 hypothetical protein Psed_6650 [Pseudonocardia dioxanivorans CB1190]GJF01723.1 hypothetical protein PSD17_06870 [Pseudonocardia sp. D17]